MNSRENITKCEVFKEDGRIISRQIVDTVLADEKNLDKMIEELDRQIAVFENTLNNVQETIKKLQGQRQALIDFKNSQDKAGV